MIGWQSERFAREGKRMKPLIDYLEPPSPQQRADDGARAVLALFQRIKAKQDREASGGV